MTTRVKICGITRQDDADAVVQAGAHALGLVFVAASPRRVALDRARQIADAVRGAVIRVGLFVNPSADEVARVMDNVDLDVLQFHGDEPADLCRSFGKPFLKAVHVRGPLAMPAIEQAYPDACCLLLDTWVPGVAGGTGTRFDWSVWPTETTLPLVLAGGLAPDNVGQAVSRLGPWGVDVSGGVEGPVKGEKDPELIRQFVREVQRARS